MTVRLHARHDELGLFFGAVRPHRCHHILESVLNEPPYARESLDDDKVVNRGFELALFVVYFTPAGGACSINTR